LLRHGHVSDCLKIDHDRRFGGGLHRNFSQESDWHIIAIEKERLKSNTSCIHRLEEPRPYDSVSGHVVPAEKNSPIETVCLRAIGEVWAVARTRCRVAAERQIAGKYKDGKMPADAKGKLVIADDHDFILSKVIEVVSDDFDVVATLNDGGRVAETVAMLKPDAVILDISMPLVDGLSAGREVKRLGLPTKIVFLTVGEDSDCMHVALALGASYVLKRRMHTDLRIALHETLAGRLFVSPFLGVAVPVAR